AAIHVKVSRGCGVIAAAASGVAADDVDGAVARPAGVAVWGQIKLAAEGLAAEALGAAAVGGGYGAIGIAGDDLGALEEAAGHGAARVQELAVGGDVADLVR